MRLLSYVITREDALNFITHGVVKEAEKLQLSQPRNKL